MNQAYVTNTWHHVYSIPYFKHTHLCQRFLLTRLWNSLYENVLLFSVWLHWWSKQIVTYFVFEEISLFWSLFFFIFSIIRCVPVFGLVYFSPFEAILCTDGLSACFWYLRMYTKALNDHRQWTKSSQWSDTVTSSY